MAIEAEELLIKTSHVFLSRCTSVLCRFPKHRGNWENIRGISNAFNNFVRTHLLAIRFCGCTIRPKQVEWKGDAGDYLQISLYITIYIYIYIYTPGSLLVKNNYQ